MIWQVRTMTGDEFKEATKAFGTSQAGIARWLDKSERTVRRYITGDLDIPVDTVLLIRAAIYIGEPLEIPAWEGIKAIKARAEANAKLKVEKPPIAP